MSSTSEPSGISPVRIATISNELTPYRLHVQRRMRDELTGVEVHNLYTHRSVDELSPWKMEIDPQLRVVFNENRLDRTNPISIRALKQFWEIRDYLLKHEIKLVILLGYADLTRMLLIRWAKKAGIPLLMTGDSNVFTDARTGGLVKMVKRVFVRGVMNHLAGLMPMGTCGRAFWRQFKDHDLPEFLYPYEPDYSLLQSKDQARVDNFQQRHQLSPQRRRFLCCCRLISFKRVDVLIKGFVRVAGQCPDWDLVIAGQGPLQKELESLVPPQLSHRVKWLGFLQFDEVVLAYHASHVMVLPSDFEPWALVINEAVAVGLPIITTSVVGAGVELVKHELNGLIVPPRNVQEMADAIVRISDPDRWQRMHEACPGVLEAWRRAADPVEGVRKALRHFKLLPKQDAKI